MKELDLLKEKCVQSMKDVDSFVKEHYDELEQQIRKQHNIPSDWFVKIISNCGVVSATYRASELDEWTQLVYYNGEWMELSF